MAQLNFPTNPTGNQEYKAAGITWTWNPTLEVWSSESADGSGGASVSVGETPPADPSDGDLWWNSADDSGRLYVYYEDDDSSQWVEASPQGLSKDEVDGLYLSKVNDDTAAGEITFRGQTTHEAGVRVTGGNISVSSLSGNSTDINIKTIVSNPDLSTVAPTQSVNLFDAYPQDAAASADSLTGFRASGKLNNKASAVYGFYSTITDNTNHFNFYAEGTAPNFFKGQTTVSNNVDAVNRFRIHPGGWALSQLTGNNSASPPITIIRANDSAAGSWSAISLRSSNADGSDQITRSIISLNGSASRMIDTRLGATGVAMADGAADIVKLLQPKVITQGGETFNGFLPADLAGTFDTAVDGASGATTAIGTYTDPEGVVETDVPEPEAIPYGATWVQTGTRDDMQGVCREELIPLLTKALQEALTEIDDLKTRLTALEGA